MNKSQLAALCFVFTAFSVVVSNVAAQQTRKSSHNSLPPLMKVLDLDKNGVLSSAEIAMAPKVLKRLDTNGDGILTVHEVTRTPPTANQRLSNYMMQKDKNGDGKLSKAELGERFERMFEASDKNKDGWLTKNEILFAVDKNSSKPVGEIKDE